MSRVRRKKELLEQLLRDEIVKAVMDLIEQHEQVTMDEVAKRCGVSKGTLYNHFQSKEELLDQVHQRILEPLIESNQAIFESNRDPLVRLHDFIDSVFCTHEKISAYFYFIWQSKTADTLFRERVDVIIHPLAKLCRQGVEAGIFIKVDPYVLAEMIYGTVIGPLTSLKYRRAEQFDPQKMKQDVIFLVNRIAC